MIAILSSPGHGQGLNMLNSDLYKFINLALKSCRLSAPLTDNIMLHGTRSNFCV